MIIFGIVTILISDSVEEKLKSVVFVLAGDRCSEEEPTEETSWQSARCKSQGLY